MQTVSDFKDSISRFLILLPLLWCFSGMYALANGDKILNVLVILAAVVRLGTMGVRGIAEHFKENKFLWIVLANFAFAVVAYFTYGISSSRFRMLSLALVYLLILPPTYLKNFNFRVLAWLLSGGLVFFLCSQYLDGNLMNRNWSINPIRVGLVSAVAVNVNLYFAINSEQVRQKVISAALAMVSILPLVLSVSRGPWLAFAVGFVVVILASFNYKKISTKLIVLMLVTLSVTLIALKGPIVQRYEQTVREVELIQSGNLNSSVGLRLQMWQAGVNIIRDHWLLGVGNSGQEEIKQGMIESGTYTKQAAHFVHFHNQWINDLAKYGVTGLLLTMLFVLLPLKNSLSKESKVLVWILVSMYMVLSLTDMPFERSHNLMFYLMTMYLLLSPVLYPEIKKPKDKESE